MTYCWAIIGISASSLFLVPSHSFTLHGGKALVGGDVSNSFRARKKLFTLHGASGNEEGGTEWIKKAMGSNDNEGDGEGAPPPSSGSPDFTQTEIDDMEGLIVSLSKVSDDEKRREALAGILDKELSADASSTDEVVLDAEIPRFAKLFQLSLDNVGEKVQNAAREIALQQQQDMEESSNGGNGDDAMANRVKSPEELQLWALIDMMVQSKTRVKLHMGSLGSKGQFR